MYIEKVPNRNSPPAILLRESYRQGGRVLKRTLLNVTHWPPRVVAGLRRLLRGEELVCLDDVFAIERSLPHGDVEVVASMIRKTGLDRLVASKRCRQRDLVLATVVKQILAPSSKLAATREWHSTSLAEEFGVADADEDDLYDALDWLLARQEKIQDKLARLHLRKDDLALYDVSSSYYEGRTCPLAFFGYGRDGKKGKPIVVYGVLTDPQGRPVSIDVYPGNTGDPATVPDQVEKLRDRFGLLQVTLVGDRGMLTQKQIDTLKQHPGLGWISALRSGSIRELTAQGAIQMSLFDRQNLAEISSPDYPGERLVVCFNPLLADERKRKREELIQATEEKLEKIVKEAARRTKKRLTEDQIGIKVGKVVNRHKVAKHFNLTIEEGNFQWERNQESVASEAALDGIYVIRTSESKERFSAEDTVRNYKSLSVVERLFRCIKTDLRVRPIYLRTAAHVRAHIFLCLLAYFVEWHLRKALAPLLFEDEELQEDRKSRDPVAPAQPSQSAKEKKAGRKTPDGFSIHSFSTLFKEMATRCKNRCRLENEPDAPTFTRLTEPTPYQEKVYKLLEEYPVAGN
jgi:Transposase DDE domain